MLKVDNKIKRRKLWTNKHKIQQYHKMTTKCQQLRRPLAMFLPQKRPAKVVTKASSNQPLAVTKALQLTATKALLRK